MKKFTFLFIYLLISAGLHAQNKGINYQAVILDPNPIELPGNNVTGQPLSNGKVCLRFAIVSPDGSSEYIETHSTQTDEFGLVNLVIGNGVSTSNDVVTLGKAVYSDFNSIKWDAKVKSLKVYVSFDACSSFKEIANQPFNYTPYSLYAGAVDYKNVDGAPTNLSYFTNDVGYLIPKDLDPIKKDILSTQNSVTNLSDKTDGKFLLVNQHLSSLDSTNRVTEKRFDTYLGILSNHDGRINANTSNIAQTNATLSQQVGGLQNQINAANYTINQLGGTYEVISNKSTDTNLGSGAPSDAYYPSQKAVKSYVDLTVQGAIESGAPDASTLTKGKVRLAGDLGGSAETPTVPGLALKENLSNKSTNVVNDAASDTKYPSVKAIKEYVDGQVTGSSIVAGSTTQYYRGDKTWQTLDKAAVGLANVDNTSDLNKPVSTATQTALNLKLAKADTASLSNRIDQRELSANKSNNIVTDGASVSKYPSVKAIKDYVDAQITGGAILEGQTTQYYRGDKTWQTLDKAAVGLANVDNTSDLNKPVSTATQTALNLKLAKADTASLSNRIDIRELLANKSNDTLLGTSTTLYPTQKAVKNYVDNKITNGLTVGTILGTSVANGATLSNGTLKLAPANASNPGIVTTGSQYFAGYKSFVQNVTINGLEIGRSNMNGLTNIVLGDGVLRNNFLGEKNIAVGDATLFTNGQGSNNIAIGHSAMYKNTAGSSNVAIGNDALYASDYGFQNVAIGQDALKSATSSDNSVAIGAKALSGLTSGLNNTIIGSLSFKSLDTGNHNTALGFDNFSALTSGYNNIVIGISNGPNFTQGNGNLVIGNNVDLQNGDGQILIGNGLGDIRAKHNARYWDFGTIGAGIWQGDVVGVEYGGTGSNLLTGYVKGNGTQAMTATSIIPVADVEGAEITANKSLDVTTDAASDEKYPSVKAVKTYVDAKTGSSVRVVSIIPDGLTNGVAISNDTLKIGHATTLYPGLMTTEGQAFAGYKNFLEEIGVKGLVLGRGRGNGIGNIALGANNLINTTFGSYNIGIGLNALNRNTSGNGNIAIGQYAFYANTTGSQNVVIGNSAFSNGYNAFGNVVLGSNTFYNASNSSFSIVIGANTLQSYNGGLDNTVIGSASLNNLSEGNSNTILGYSNLTSAQSSYANVVVGSNNGPNFVRGDNNVLLGNSIDVPDGTSGNVFIGDGLGNIRANHDGTSWKLGLIGSGTWQGDSITIAHGGTGATTKEGAFDALSPMSAAGDLIYGGTNGTGTRLAAGSDGQVLTLSNGVPGWSTPSSEKVTTSPNLSSADNGSTLFTNTNVNLPNDVLPDGFRVNIVNTSSNYISVNSTSANNLNYQQNSNPISDQTTATLKPYSKMEVYYYGNKFILVGDFNFLN